MATDETVEIYALCHPTTGEVRYIGKTRDTRKRLVKHLADSRRRNTPVYCWIRKLACQGLVPVAIILEAVEANAWRETERRVIAEHRASNRLLNVADGGDEPFCPIPVRAANGRKNAKARASTPLKQRIWLLKRAIGEALKDGFVTEGGKEKLRYAARKRPDLFGEWATV